LHFAVGEPALAVRGGFVALFVVAVEGAGLVGVVVAGGGVAGGDVAVDAGGDVALDVESLAAAPFFTPP
jgi:hypothetical protein